jgi:oxygen-independent coproporphyrinogen-3 oxidase
MFTPIVPDAVRDSGSPCGTSGVPVAGAGAAWAEQQYRRALAALSDRPGMALALAVKLPFCAARCLCCDRDVQAAQSRIVIDDYVGGLIQEIRMLAACSGPGRDLLQLHLGGGTANELSDSQLVRLMHAVQAHWRVPADADLVAEIDPRRARRAQLQLLRGLGFRNLTLGVLDLDTRVQQAIGRSQSVALIDDVCELARRCDIETINLDLLVGLPHQTPARWRTTLQRVIAMCPDRVTLCQYRHRPQQVAPQRAIDSDTLPDAQARRELGTLAAELLCQAGYRWIGANQFVLETDELSVALDQRRLRRSLISYTAAPPTPVLGIGAGAVAEVDGNLFWHGGPLPHWRQAVRDGRLPATHARLATAGAVRRQQAVEQLMCRLELSSVYANGGLEDAYARLARRAEDGLVQILPDRLKVTEAGRLALQSLCAELHGPATADDPSLPHWLF